MSPFSKIIPLVVLAWLCQLSLAGKLVSGNSVYTTQQRFEKELIENMTVPRIYCYQPPHQLNERLCNVSLITNDGERSVEPSCAVTLKPYTEDRVLSESYYDVKRLDKETVMVIWVEYAPTYDVTTGKVHLRIVARLRELWMSDCTTTKHETQIFFRGNDTHVTEYEYFIIYIVPYGDNTFDVLYPDKGDWNGYDFCKQSYERKTGKPVGKMTCIPSTHELPPHLTFHPIDPTAKSSRGYLVFVPRENLIESHLIDAEGTSKRLSVRPMVGNIYRRFASSSAYNGYTICDKYQNKSIIVTSSCTQYGLDGAEKLTIDFVLEEKEKIVEVYNLQDGGFAILTITCSSNISCSKSDTNKFHVTKIGSDGKRFASLEVPEFKCNYDVLYTDEKLRFFENEADELCVALMCYATIPEIGGLVANDYKVSSKCFSDKVLLKKRIE